MIVRVPRDMESYVAQYLAVARTQVADVLRPDHRNPGRFKTLGHNLKGSAPSFGLVELGRLGAELEAAAAAQDQAGLEQSIHDLQQHLATIQVEVE
jgi:HPt (histidine-containing phosphotransfer) domain-containing protein